MPQQRRNDRLRITLTLDRSVHTGLRRLAARCGYRSPSSAASALLGLVMMHRSAQETCAAESLDDEVRDMFDDLSCDLPGGRWQANNRT